MRTTNQKRKLRILRHSDVHIAVLTVREMGGRIGMGGGAIESLATAVSELTTNILKYAGTGRVSLRQVKRRHQPGLEVVVEDEGRGIEDLESAMKDNVSSGGSLGLGLPGTKRLVDEFEIESQPGKGTRVRIVKWG